MTKQLPIVEQAQIKLALSNSVLSAEVKCNEQSYFTTLTQNQKFEIVTLPSPDYQ